MRLYPFKATYLLWPIVFILALFLLDKLFLLPEVRDNFLQPGGSIYYRQRAEQLEIFRKAAPELRARKFKVGVVLGDSRSFSIGNLSAAAARMLLKMPTEDYRLFNFAGPQAVPAYHHYIVGRLFARLPEERPSHVLIGLSPDAFNRNAFIFADPVLKFGVDSAWIEANRAHIPAADFDAYWNTRRYALPGINFNFKELYLRTLGEFAEPIPPSFTERMTFMGMMSGSQAGDDMPESIRETFTNAGAYLEAMAEAKQHDLSLYSYKQSPQRKLLNLYQGSQYLWIGAASDADLRTETRTLEQLYLRNFVVSQEQFHFLAETLRIARQGGAEVIVFWPRVNPYLRAAYKKEPRVQAVWRRVVELSEAAGARAIDLNQDGRLNCDAFYDASHMSVTCFPLLAGTLLGEFR